VGAHALAQLLAGRGHVADLHGIAAPELERVEQFLRTVD